MPVLGNVHRTIGASCYQYSKECSLVLTPSWLSAGIGMPLSSEWALSAPLYTNRWCRTFLLPALPPRDFGEWLPVARDVYCAVALFLQVRVAHPDLIQKHRGAGSLLLTPRLARQGTFAKLFADIGVDGDIRYAQVEELLRHGPPAPAFITPCASPPGGLAC